VIVVEYKINTLLPIQFEKIENPPYLNDSRFQAVRCYVAHEKENDNGSYFDLSVLKSMGKKMAGVPIVGYISVNNVNEKDFNGHEERLLIDNDGVSIEYLGRAYGCIISNNDVSIVDRMHKDGKMRKYLCVTGVLWKMFTDSIDIFDRDTTKGHSMELQEDSIVGKFEKDGYYHFSEATVRALCILGEGISPAMSNSVIEKFSQENIDYSIQELLKEVNESIKQFSRPQFKIDSYWIENEKAQELVVKADSIFKNLGFECLEWIVDGKEFEISGVINKKLNEEASKMWGIEIYDRDYITIHTNDLDKLEQSSISLTSVDLLLSKKGDKQKFSLIPKKLEQSNFNINSGDKGGMQVDKLEIVAKYNLTVEQLDFNIDEYSIEELEEKLKEFSLSVIFESDMDSMMDEMMDEMKDAMTEEMKAMMDKMKEKIKKKIKKMKPKEGMMSQNKNIIDSKFSATYRQKREALQNALDPKIEKDADGNVTYEEYLWVEDFDDTYVFVEKSIWTPDNYERKYGRYSYAFNEETITATISGEFEEMVLVWLTLEENQKLQEERNNATVEYEKLKGEFEDYKNKYSTSNEEVIRLQEFEKTKLSEERQTAETELFSKFDEELNTDEQYKTLKTKASEFSLEELEIKCFAMLGKKKANFSLNKKDNSTIKIKVEHKEEVEQDSPYGDLHSKYLK
jgi:hypothetical protein